MYLLASFIAQNLKKNLTQIQGYEDAPFLGQNDQITPINLFSEKPLI